MTHLPPPSQHDLSDDAYEQMIFAGYSVEMATKVKTRLLRNDPPVEG